MDPLERSSRDNNDEKPSKKGAAVFLLQVANILGWYWANGMNGIEMQSFAGEQENEGSAKHASAKSLKFLHTLAVTSFVTCLQLLMGAWMGRVLLFGLNRKLSWRQATSTHWWLLSVLHAVGSLTTNLGFMHGKASSIQLLKLLEPFETLGLSLLFFREGTINEGVASSMLLVVGAATSLLKIQTTKTSRLAVVFAVLSGLSLSARNVLQRKHLSSVHESFQSVSKLERSIIQFTLLSFYSGIGLGSVSAILFSVIHPNIVSLPIGIVFWHPIYNVLSMIALGFSSALTHSLLNAGKRVFSILLTVLWFQEGLDANLMIGLLLVFVGGSWYSYEIKQKQNLKASTTITKSSFSFRKLILSVAALGLLAKFHQSS